MNVAAAAMAAMAISVICFIFLRCVFVAKIVQGESRTKQPGCFLCRFCIDEVHIVSVDGVSDGIADVFGDKSKCDFGSREGVSKCKFKD